MRTKSNEYKIWKKYQDEKNLKLRTKRKKNKKSNRNFKKKSNNKKPNDVGLSNISDTVTTNQL